MSILTPSQSTLLKSRVLVDVAGEAAREGDRCECGGLLQVEALEIVHAWHDVTHPGVFQFCDRQPCHAISYARR